MISSDRLLFRKGSDVRKRITVYSNLVDHLDVIILSKKGNYSTEEVAPHLTLHPTSSLHVLWYVFDAVHIGKSLKNIDVITTQNPGEMGIIGWLLARKLGARLEVQLHGDVFSYHADRYASWWHPVGFLRRMLSRFVLPRADCVRTVSKHIVASLKREVKLRQEPSVLPVFVDVQWFVETPARMDLRATYPQFEKIVLWVGRLEKEKNAALAIRVMEDVVRNHPTAGLVIVGDGREQKYLEHLAMSLGLDKHVVFEGWQDDVLSRYKTADVLLVTSWYESYGRMIVEALATGLPVVSRDVGVARETGAFVVPDKKLAERVQETLSQGKGLVTLKNYPYTSEQEYVYAITSGWERCGEGTSFA